MTKISQPTVHRGEGQSYWDRLREIDAILARISTIPEVKRAEIRRWLASDPRSGASNGRK